MRFAFLIVIACGFVLAAGRPAFANGRFPASNQIAFAPADPNLIVLRTTYGLLVSRDGGGTWQWLCEDVLGILSSSTEDPVIGMATGSIVATPGLASGVLLSRDQGCDFTAAAGPLQGQLVKDLAVRPDAPGTVVAMTSTYGAAAGAEGGAGYVQQAFESTDDGATWAAIGAPIDPGALVTTIEVAAANDDRIYVSAVRSNGQIASLFVSDDHGAHWTERPVPIDPALEGGIYVAAVDPMDADLVYVRTQGIGGTDLETGAPRTASRLLVSRDAGQTFTVALALAGPMLGFALSQDGSRVYAGSIQDGLFAASRDSLAFAKVSAVHVQCLGTHGADLWACSDEISGFVAGVSTDQGASFTAKVHLVGEPLLACPADAGASVQCGGSPRQALCLALPCVEATTDAGDAGTTAAAAAASSCGCAAAGLGGAAGWAAALMGGALGVALRARARARIRRRGPG